MNHIGTQEIETERLILRRFKFEDASSMFKNYTSRDKVTEYLTWFPHNKLEDTQAYLEDYVLPQYEKKDTYKWAIVIKEKNEVIGCIDVIESLEDKRRAELGWVLSDDYWGQGIMPEAGREVLKVLFSVGYERIQAIHDVKNPKSGRVMQKIGMTREGVLAKYCPNRENILTDCDMWAITKEQYEEM